MGIKEKLGFGSDSADDDISEEELKKLEARKRKLERKQKVKQMKQRVKQLEDGGGGDNGGLLSKLGRIGSDLTKSGHKRALNHLVGPPESAELTESFVVGPSVVSGNDGSVSDFLLGDNNPEKNEDIGIDFPIKNGGNGGDFEDYEKITEV